MMDGQVIRGIHFHACNSRVKIAVQEERRKRQEHLGDTTVSVVVLGEWESENILLDKIGKYVSKLILNVIA